MVLVVLVELMLTLKNYFINRRFNMLEEDVNLIEDDNFLNKDVSELIVDDYYLFDMQDTPSGVKLYFYKDGIVFVSLYSNIDDTSIIDKFEYTSGSLQEMVEKLNEH